MGSCTVCKPSKSEIKAKKAYQQLQQKKKSKQVTSTDNIKEEGLIGIDTKTMKLLLTSPIETKESNR